MTDLLEQKCAFSPCSSGGGGGREVLSNSDLLKIKIKKDNMPIMYFFFQGGGGLVCREPADYGSPESVPEGRGQSHD